MPETAILSALQERDAELRLEVEGEQLHFTSLDKELWPGVTKRALLRYYAGISETLLPYLMNRPITFVRCPAGVQGERFFQKHWDRGRPEFVEVVSVFSESNEGPRDFLMCNNLATLMWLGQLDTLELNPWNSHIKKGECYSASKEELDRTGLNRPDYLAFDLDPWYEGKAKEWKRSDWQGLVEVALALKDLVASVGLDCYPKSSGKAGLHVFVPLAPEHSYDEVRAMTRTFGREIVERLGDKATIETSVRKRPHTAFIDVNQNVRGKTMAAVYSPRASTGAGVSIPLAWDELETIDPTKWTVLTAAKRLCAKGDLWAPVLSARQQLSLDQANGMD